MLIFHMAPTIVDLNTIGSARQGRRIDTQNSTSCRMEYDLKNPSLRGLRPKMYEGL